jgi:hypothetical protein
VRQGRTPRLVLTALADLASWRDTFLPANEERQASAEAARERYLADAVAKDGDCPLLDSTVYDTASLSVTASDPRGATVTAPAARAAALLMHGRAQNWAAVLGDSRFADVAQSAATLEFSVTATSDMQARAARGGACGRAEAPPPQSGNLFVDVVIFHGTAVLSRILVRRPARPAALTPLAAAHRPRQWL